ncbi:MAG: DUF721 domain-containing protein [Nitrospirota bacterium]
MKRAGSLLAPLISNLGLEDALRLAEIKSNWHKLFNDLSYHMSPFKLSNGEIILNVDSPVWLQELNFHKETIIKKLRSHGINTIRLRLGRVSTVEKSEVKSQKSEVKALTSEELSFIEKTVSQINDQDLKDKIKKAIEKSILRKNRNPKS